MEGRHVPLLPIANWVPCSQPALQTGIKINGDHGVPPQIKFTSGTGAAAAYKYLTLGRWYFLCQLLGVFMEGGKKGRSVIFLPDARWVPCFPPVFQAEFKVRFVQVCAIDFLC